MQHEYLEFFYCIFIEFYPIPHHTPLYLSKPSRVISPFVLKLLSSGLRFPCEKNLFSSSMKFINDYKSHVYQLCEFTV